MLAFVLVFVIELVFACARCVRAGAGAGVKAFSVCDRVVTDWQECQLEIAVLLLLLLLLLLVVLASRTEQPADRLHNKNKMSTRTRLQHTYLSAKLASDAQRERERPAADSQQRQTRERQPEKGQTARCRRAKKEGKKEQRTTH